MGGEGMVACGTGDVAHGAFVHEETSGDIAVHALDASKTRGNVAKEALEGGTQGWGADWQAPPAATSSRGSFSAR
jgi:hypothetical protein